MRIARADDAHRAGMARVRKAVARAAVPRAARKADGPVADLAVMVDGPNARATAVVAAMTVDFNAGMTAATTVVSR